MRANKLKGEVIALKNVNPDSYTMHNHTKSVTAVHCPIVLKSDTMVRLGQQRLWNYRICRLVHYGPLKPSTTGATSGGRQVALHRNSQSPIFSAHLTLSERAIIAVDVCLSVRPSKACTLTKRNNSM